MSQSTFDSLLQKYLAGKCTPAEEQIILEWYERLIDDSNLHLSEEERNVIEARLWASIQTNTTEAEVAPPGRVVRFKPLRWVAAAIFLGIVGSLAFYYWKGHSNLVQEGKFGLPAPEAYSQMINGTMKESRVVLADSTIILLQPNAALYYPKQFSGDTREVYLTGSAFFQVRHDPAKHFIVHAEGQLTTEVLGTSFHIIQHKATDKIEVQVVTGKVCVYQQNKRPEEKRGEATARIILTPNKKVVFNAVTNEFVTGIMDEPQPQPQVRALKDEAEAADNRFVFEDEPLEKVLQVMSKAYGLDITVESEKLARVHFTGNISKYDLYKQLDIICRSTKCTYEVDGEKIVLKRTANIPEAP